MVRHANQDGNDEEVSHGQGAYVNLEMLGSSPFTQEVDESMLPNGFKLLTIESYDGTVDPIDHLEMFRISMSIQRASDAIMCKAFPPL